MLLAFLMGNGGNNIIICAEFERLEEEWRVDAEWIGYGDKNIIEVFWSEGIDIKKQLDDMKIGDIIVHNIGWWSGCGIRKRGVKLEIIKFGGK